MSVRSVRVLLGLVLALGGAACGGTGPQTDREKLQQIIRRTEPLARNFTYVDLTSDRRVDIAGTIEDGFRYQANISVDGVLTTQHVVSDDSVALRVASVQHLPLALPSAAAALGTSPSAAALNAGGWVVDKAGAPPVTQGANERRVVGDNPVTDALTVLAYVEQASAQARQVVEFNPDALDYFPQEDPFPTPDPDGEIDRFDLRAPDLPQVSELGGGNQAVPGIEHFRKMSVYVRDGRVIEVREDVDVPSRLEDLQRIYGVEFPEELPESEVVSVAVESINALRRGQGNDPIRVRRMSVAYRDFGSPAPLAIPAAADGDLKLLRPAAGGATTVIGGAQIPSDVAAAPDVSTGLPQGDIGTTLPGVGQGGGPTPPPGFNLGALSEQGRLQPQTSTRPPAPSSGAVVAWLVVFPLLVAGGAGVWLRLRGGAAALRF